MEYLKSLLILVCLITFATACKRTKPQTGVTSSIDNSLQMAVDSILRIKMEEICATVGQVIVMEVETGDVKASVSLDSTFHVTDTEILQESGLLRTTTLYATLETGHVVLSDTLDTGDGIMVIDGDTLRDHNWHRGGYGEITVERGFDVSSNISKYWIAKKAFGDELAFAKAMRRFGYVVKDTTLVYNSIGYGIPVTPMQNLTFYNRLAKENSAVADSVRSALESAVYEGLAKPAQVDGIRVAGATGTARFIDDSYAVEFCGYFPADHPKYSVIVTMNKKGLPASSGLMAGDVFRQIAEYMKEGTINFISN